MAEEMLSCPVSLQPSNETADDTEFTTKTFNRFCGNKLPAVLNYVTTVNHEYAKLKNKLLCAQQELSCASRIIEEQAQLRKHKRKRKRTSNDSGGFVQFTTASGGVHNNQKLKAVRSVEKAIDAVANTSQKKQEVLQSIGGQSTIVQAKIAIADSVLFVVQLLRNILFVPLQMTHGHLMPMFRWLLYVCIPHVQAKQQMADIKNVMELPRRSRYFTTAQHQKQEMNPIFSQLQNSKNIFTLSAEDQRAVIRSIQIRSKKKRSDALTAKDKLDIERAWVENCEICPNAADVVRKIDKNGKTITMPIHQFYNRIEDVRNWLIVHLHKRLAISTVWLNRPWYVRKGKPDTCMCHYCENIRLAKKAIMDNNQLLNRPTRTIRALYTIQKCILRRRRRIRAKLLRMVELGNPLTPHQLALINMENDTRTEDDLNVRYPTMTIVSMCRGAFKSKILDRVLCPNAMPVYRPLSLSELGKPECIGHANINEECQKCKKKLRLLRFEAVPPFDVKIMEDICNNTSIMKDQFWTEDDKITYCTWGDDTGDNNTAEMREHTTSPVQFFDAFLNRLAKYAEHIGTLRRSKFAAMQEEHNMLIFRAILDMDFSQNYNFGSVYRNAIQSAHWKNNTATLFTAVFRCLCHKTFFDISTCLLKGDEVSFFDEPSGLYHYGRVMRDEDRDEYSTGQVAVKIEYDGIFGKLPGAIHLLQRVLLRRRKILTIPIIVVSNDKHHDTGFVNYFLHQTFADWFEANREKYTSKITEISVHSDGAASHFKNKDSIGCLITLKAKLSLARISWLFGCPGHGKGVWDGLGGIIKNGTTIYLIRHQKPMGEVEDVFKLIKQLFAPDEQNELLESDTAKQGSKLKCEPWHICYGRSVDIELFRTSAGEEKKQTRIALKGSSDADNSTGKGDGTRSMFYYEAVGNGVQLVYRKYGCSCIYCMKGWNWLNSEPELRRSAGIRSNLVLTLVPETEACVLQEPFLFQHLTMVLIANPKNQTVIDDRLKKGKQGLSLLRENNNSKMMRKKKA
jgi:hypothetical protein